MSILSPKRQARIAGALYLVVILAGMFAEVFVRPKIMVAGDAAATAHNLAAHVQLYRVGLLTDLLTVVAAVAEGVLVYYLFKPLNAILALTSLLIAIVSNAGEVVSGLIHLLPLIILHGGHASQMLPPGQLEELAQLAIRTHTGFLAITLAIFSFALCIDGYLVCISTFVPRVIGVLLIIASACYLINSVATCWTCRWAHSMDSSWFPRSWASFRFASGCWYEASMRDTGEPCTRHLARKDSPRLPYTAKFCAGHSRCRV